MERPSDLWNVLPAFHTAPLESCDELGNGLTKVETRVVEASGGLLINKAHISGSYDLTTNLST